MGYRVCFWCLRGSLRSRSIHEQSFDRVLVEFWSIPVYVPVGLGGVVDWDAKRSIWLSPLAIVAAIFGSQDPLTSSSRSRHVAVSKSPQAFHG